MPMHSPRLKLSRVLPLALLTACSSPAGPEQTAERLSTLTTTGLFFQGHNFSGAERGFGPELEESGGPPIPTVEGQTHRWPTPPASAPAGMNIVRSPFQWEHLQPTLNQAFDAAYLAKLHSTAGAWRDLGANALLDAHYYPYYKVNGRGTSQSGQQIGSAEAPIAAFVDLWGRFASA